MQEHILFLVLGVGSGAVIAALALGIVVGYQGSGVVNFAHGAVAMFITYQYAELRTNGSLFVPPLPNPLMVVVALARVVGADLDLPDIPTHVDVGDPFSFWPAFAISVVLAAAVGCAMHAFLFRPMRYSPPLAKVVVTVGLMLWIQASVVARFGPNNHRSIPKVLPDDPVTVLGASVPRDRWYLVLLVLLAAGVLSAVFRYTRVGLAIRAGAESDKAATLLGLRADRLAGISWVTASIMAGVVGVLAAPITALSPSGFTLLIIPALAAALLGGFSSFWLTACAGLFIGMIQSEMYLLELRWSWVPDIGLREAIPFAALIAAVIFRGSALPVRGSVVGDGRLPEVPTSRNHGPALVALVGLTAVMLVWGPPDWRFATANSLIGVVTALSLVVITGFVGQISLAQTAFAGISGFALGTLTTELGVPFLAAIVLAPSIAALFGLAVGWPVLRARGINLAIMTLGVGLVVEILLFSRDGWFGTASFKKVASPELFGLDIGSAASFPFGDGKLPSPAFGLTLLVIVVLVGAGVVRVQRSQIGRTFLAVRSNERAAASTGIDVRMAKLLAFGISAFIAGLSGALRGYQFGALSPSSFGVFVSLAALTFAYLGGISSTTGAMLAGLLFTGGIGFHFLETVADVEGYEVIVGSSLLVVTAVTNPDGLAGLVRRVIPHRTSISADGAAVLTEKQEVM